MADDTLPLVPPKAPLPAATPEAAPRPPRPPQEAPRVNGQVAVLQVDEREVEITAMRAQGAGGQNVNKVSSAVHLRFDIAASSSLSEGVKERLLALRDSRITQEGVVVIKAQQYRSQEQNRSDAVERLNALVNTVAAPPRVRRATKPTYGSKQRRLAGKSQRSETKALRGRVVD